MTTPPPLPPPGSSAAPQPLPSTTPPTPPPTTQPPGSPAALTAVRTAARDLVRLVLPVRCPGCGLWDRLLCDACAAALGTPVRRVEHDAPRLDRDPEGLVGLAPLPVWAATAYTGPVRGVVVAWKDHGRLDLTDPLVAAVRRAARGLTVLGAAAQGSVVHVVPVPSSARARRRRGVDLVGELAAGAVCGLRQAGVPASVAPVLRRGRGRDQVGLGARARAGNSAGSFVPRRGADVRARPVLLVDDVLTTGATLAACDDAVSGSGGLVLGALVLAATPPPDRRRGTLSAGRSGD